MRRSLRRGVEVVEFAFIFPLFLILFFAMHRFAGDIGGGDLISLLGKLVIAVAAMSFICIAANYWLFADLSRLSMWHRALWLMLTICCAQLAYFFIANLMKIAEAKEAIAMVTRKLRG